jgi:hypothetical protein
MLHLPVRQRQIEKELLVLVQLPGCIRAGAIARVDAIVRQAQSPGSVAATTPSWAPVLHRPQRPWCSRNRDFGQLVAARPGMRPTQFGAFGTSSVTGRSSHLLMRASAKANICLEKLHPSGFLTDNNPKSFGLPPPLNAKN